MVESQSIVVVYLPAEMSHGSTMRPEEDLSIYFCTLVRRSQGQSAV